MKHLLVTNDYPPKIGGIQSLLWEWWRRLPADKFAVLTSPYEGTEEFDAGEGYRIERTREPVLLPHPYMVHQVNELAKDFGADLVVLDPAVPLGLIGPSLDLPYDLVLHGADHLLPHEAAAVVGDVHLAVGPDGSTVGSAAEIGNHRNGPIRGDTTQRASGDLDKNHAPVSEGDRPFGKQKSGGDGANLRHRRTLFASERASRP